MKKLTAIGLDAEKSTLLAEKLNVLLAGFSIFYMNVRGFHWNIRGEKFFELHLKFEEIYNDLQVKIDEIAERILTLGHIPAHAYSTYYELSKVVEVKDVSDGRTAVSLILEAYGKVIVLERELLELSAEAGDEGTNALMSDYIREQEKTVWMLNAWLG